MNIYIYLFIHFSLSLYIYIYIYMYMYICTHICDQTVHLGLPLLITILKEGLAGGQPPNPYLNAISE